jgi:hypothetical protein
MSNLYNQPLLNIVGMTVSYTTFFVAVAFLKHMKEADDKWSLKQLQWAASNNCDPWMIVTDWDLVLLNAIAQTYPEVVLLLCQWHINKTMTAHCLPFFWNLPAMATATPS